MNENLLKIENLTIEVEQRKLLSRVNLEISSNEVVAIVGKSGSGKSTLLHAIMGSMPLHGKATEGKIGFEEKDLLTLKEKDWTPIRGKKIAMVFQDPSQAFHPITKIKKQYLDIVRTHNKRMVKSRELEKAKILFQKLHLTNASELLNRYPFELSGGMQQRVAIAMALATNPKLLLADEPTSSLDATIQAQVIKELIDVKDNFHTAMIIVTHNIAVAAHMADKIGVMDQGEIVEWASGEEILYNPKHAVTRELIDSVPSLEVDG